MSVVLDWRTISQPLECDNRLTVCKDRADDKSDRKASELNLRRCHHGCRLPFGATDGRWIGPGLAENIAARRHVGSRSDARRGAGKMNAVHEELWRIRKITRAGW